MLLSAGDDARRDRRTTTGQPRPPVAPLPLVLGVLRRLEGAPVLDPSSRPIRRLGARGGVGGAALVLAMLAGQHARAQVGQRLEERGRFPRLQPGGTRAALQEDRVGHRRDALLAAHHTNVCGARALKALEVEAMPPPGLPQDTTTMALSGASEDEPPPQKPPDPRLGLAQPAVPLASRCCSVWG